MSDSFFLVPTVETIVEPSSANTVIVEQVIVTEILEIGIQGPPGIPGPKGDVSVVPIRMVTTPPIQVLGGQMQLPSIPLGDVVWNTAIVYSDLQFSDLDPSGALSGTRDYPVAEHIVRTNGGVVIFTAPPPQDGLYAVVSYLTAGAAAVTPTVLITTEDGVSIRTESGAKLAA